MLLKFLRWIFGYISFEVRGECLEKLINFSIKNDIRLWDLKKSNKSLSGKISAFEYNNFAEISKKYNLEIEIIKKTGFPFVKHKYRKRWGILVGTGIFFTILWISSMYVWSVNVFGNNEISSHDVIEAAAACGVAPGSLKRNIDSSTAEQMIMSKLQNISWMSVNIEGSCVNIVVKEKIAFSKTVEESEPCNIVASKDGQIDRLETYKGIPVVSSGDVVTTGQLLVSGVVETPDFKSSLIHADCKVFAKTKRSITKIKSLNIVQAKDTGKVVKKHKIKIFNWEIPISFRKDVDDTYRYENITNNLNFFGVKLPVVICSEIWHEQECCETIITPEEAKKDILEEISQNELKESDGIQILEKSEDEKEENGEYIYNLSFYCIENIGKSEKIELE